MCLSSRTGSIEGTSSMLSLLATRHVCGRGVLCFSIIGRLEASAGLRSVALIRYSSRRLFRRPSPQVRFHMAVNSRDVGRADKGAKLSTRNVFGESRRLVVSIQMRSWTSRGVNRPGSLRLSANNITDPASRHASISGFSKGAPR